MCWQESQSLQLACTELQENTRTTAEIFIARLSSLLVYPTILSSLQLSAELLICAYKGNTAASSGEAEEERGDLERLGKTRKDGFFFCKRGHKAVHSFQVGCVGWVLQSDLKVFSSISLPFLTVISRLQ